MSSCVNRIHFNADLVEIQPADPYDDGRKQRSCCCKRLAFQAADQIMRR